METAYFQESLEEVRADLEQLLTQHWREIPFDTPPQPDWDGYATFERAGQLRIFTARVRGELVGCCMFKAARNFHYKSSLQAAQDLLLVAPEYRDGAVATHLILFAERHLRDEGVQVVYHRASGMASTLERAGYELVEAHWAKRLDSPK